MSWQDQYFLDTKSVLFAGQELHQAAADPIRLKAAVERLASAADRHSQGSQQAHAFMFEQNQAASGTAAEAATGDAMAIILTDLQVANVLIAAGQVADEVGTPAQPELLNDALKHLASTSTVVERALNDEEAGSVGRARFMFESGSAPAAPALLRPSMVQSPDLATASQTFRDRGELTLTAFVTDAHGAVTDVYKQMKNVDFDKIGQAINNLGARISVVQTTWNLIKKGMAKVITAISSLARLFGQDALDKIKQKIADLWDRLVTQDAATVVVSLLMGVDAARDKVRKAAAQHDISVASLDGASDAVTALTQRFHDDMAIIKGLGAAIGAGAFLLSLTPAATFGWTVAAASYALLLAAILLIGTDFTDSGDLLRRVFGVGMIAESIVPASK